MSRPSAMLVVAVTALSVACGYVLPAIRLTGRAADLEALVGEWSGHYESDAPYARSGTIWFKLAAGENHAHGDVRMVPEGFTRGYERYRGGPGPAGHEFPPASESLAIRFVRAENNQVNGVLEPYWDPDRECQARTSFRGRIEGKTIVGTFVSIYARPLPETTGVWKVTRR
jgi:hypothetical protein